MNFALISAKTRELPYNTPYGAKKTLIVSSLESWEIIAHQAIDDLRPAVFQVVEKLLSNSFGRYTAGPLRNLAGVVVRDEIEKLFTTAKNHVDWLIQMESDPFTMNEHYLSSKQTIHLTRFKSERRKTEISSDPHQVTTALADLNLLGISTEEGKLPRLLDDDSYREELEVAAFVMAYWNVAYKVSSEISPTSFHF